MRQSSYRGCFLGCALMIGLCAVACTETAEYQTNAQALDRQNWQGAVTNHGQLYVLVELEQQPTAQIFSSIKRQFKGKTNSAQARMAAISQLAVVKSEQESFVQSFRALELPDTDEIFRLQRVYNGVVLRTRPTNLTKLAALQGVKGVHPIVPQEVQHQHSVPLIGAYEFWETQNMHGEGIKVGIIDTGIDYLHADFGGPGAAADYQSQDFSIIEDGTFPTAKVVGGWDFAGTFYDAGNASFGIPVPDPDPLDGAGHGTHVAGSVAGLGVLLDDSTYAGSYDMSLDPEQFLIAPGVAPQVELYALKVFGDGSGSTVLPTLALEWALDPDADGDFSDHLDVVNLSLGGGYGSGSPIAHIYNNAVAAGLIVVASAGNSGDSYFITGAPAQAEAAISVAASMHDGIALVEFEVEEGSSVTAGLYEMGTASFGPQEWAPLTGSLEVPLVVLDDAENSDDPEGCSAFLHTDFTGTIALLDRGNCNFSTKVQNAQDAGALAVVIANNNPAEGVIWMGGQDPGTITIPSVSISYELGSEITTALGLSETVTVTLDRTLRPHPELQDSIASFSSRGPIHDGNLVRLKPDITAPGVDITSAANLTGTEGVAFGGTSMSSPHVAGVMALLRQLHPDWTSHQLKALVMNTAGNDVTVDGIGGTKIGPGRVGAGRVDLAQAMQTEVIAYSADAPQAVSVSFANIDVVGSVTEAKVISAENLGDAAVTYDLSVDQRSDVAGASFELTTAGPVTVEAKSTTDITVTLTANSAEMERGIDPGLSDYPDLPGSRYNMSEEAAYLLLTPQGGGQVLRVPLYAVLRPASDIMAAADSLAPDATGYAEITLSGSSDENLTSLVTPFELKYASPAGDQIVLGGEELPPEWDTTQAASADLEYVGVTSDLREWLSLMGPALAHYAWDYGQIYFGLVMHGLFGSPLETGYYILIDTDQDFRYDYYLSVGAADVDLFEIGLFDAEGNPIAIPDEEGQPTDAYYSAPFNGFYPEAYDHPFIPSFMSDAIVLPVSIAGLGLTSRNAKINFMVQTYNYPLLDSTPWLQFDPTMPGVEFSVTRALEGKYPDQPTAHDKDGEVIQAKVDPTATNMYKTGKILLIHHHNPAGARGEVIDIQGSVCTADADCAVVGGYCDTLTGVCVSCTDSSQCWAGGYCGSLRMCETDCTALSANSCPGGAFCDMMTGECVQDCTWPDAQACPEGTYCDADSGACMNPKSLMVTTDLANGDANCADGGSKIEIGLDLNNNDLLDTNEIEETRYVCNGAHGQDGQPGQDGKDGGCSATGQGHPSLLLYLLFGLPFFVRRRKD